MVELILLGNKILVEPVKRQETTQGGLIIPVVVNKNVEEGVVLSVSSDVLHINRGDTILYPSGAGIPITIDNVNYKFISGPVKDSPGDVIAIL